MVDDKKLTKRDKKYCSCVMMVMGEQRKNKEKDTDRKNPYALCTWSLYNREGKERKGQIDCKKYYKYEKYNLDSIKEYAKRNGIKITGKKKQELIDELYKKDKKKT